MKTSRLYKIVILGTLLLIATCSFAQSKPTYTIKGDKLEKVEEPKKTKEATKTSWTIDIKETTYPVFKGTKGSYYILRESKKTGKEYKQYINIEEPKK